jgi:hypothetical protein
MENPEITGLPYAPWLEEALQGLVNFPVKGICMYVTTETGDVYSNYYNMNMADKIYVAGLIQQDAMYDSLEANGMVEFDDEDGEKEGA